MDGASETKYCYSRNDAGQRPIGPILRYYSVVNMEKDNFTNFENLYKVNENSYNDIFFAVVIRRINKFILAKQKFWGSVAL